MIESVVWSRQMIATYHAKTVYLNGVNFGLAHITVSSRVACWCNWDSNARVKHYYI